MTVREQELTQFLIDQKWWLSELAKQSNDKYVRIRLTEMSGLFREQIDKSLNEDLAAGS